MARDEHLLHNRQWRPAVLRLYGWTPATISLGCFQRFADVAELPPDVRDLPVVRRATGGGAILHDREVTYALMLDETLPLSRRGPADAYRLVHACWMEALADGGPICELAPDSFPPPSPRGGPFFCFEKPGRTDLLIAGVKVLGSAQRRTAGRVLQHGSLILGRRFASHPGANLGDPPAERVAAWTERFIQALAAALELAPQRTEWTPEALADVEQRRAVYAGEEWTERRIRPKA